MAGFVIGTDVKFFINGLPVLAGSIDHSFEEEVVVYSSFEGDLIGFVQSGGSFTVETPETSANPLDAAIIAQRLTKLPAVASITDLTTGQTAISQVGVSRVGKSRKPKTAATRTYKCTIAGNEIEV